MADDRKLDYDRYILAPTHEEQPPDDPDEYEDEPRGGDGDTDHRCCLGSALTGHEFDCSHSTLASMNQHVEQLEQDLEAARKAHQLAEEHNALLVKERDKARASALRAEQAGAAAGAYVAVLERKAERLGGELALAKSSLGSVPMRQHTALLEAVGSLVATISGVLDEAGWTLTKERRRELWNALEVVKQEAGRG